MEELNLEDLLEAGLISEDLYDDLMKDDDDAF